MVTWPAVFNLIVQQYLLYSKDELLVENGCFSLEEG